MPANLPPQYKEAENRYRQAKAEAEKIMALEEMLAIIPHHKGTDKLIAQLRKRLSQHKDESQRRSPASRKSDPFAVRKEGAAQVVLLGLPNSGKSRLLSALTNARPLVADYPFTTRALLPGMVKFENIQIQLVDAPPLMDSISEAGLYTLLRNADAIAVVLDLSEDPEAQMELIFEELAKHRIRILPKEEEGQEREMGFFYKQAVFLGNKVDVKESQRRCREWLDRYSKYYPVLCLSAKEEQNLDALKEGIFSVLGKIRAYPMAPGKQADLNDPVILPKGSTVLDFASQIHKDFLTKLKFARIWSREKYDGQMVQRDYVLQDGDIIELRL